MSSPEAPIGAAPPAADAGGVDDEDRLVRVDVVGHHIAQARFGMPANLLAAGLLLWTLWPMAHHGRLVAWYVTVGLSQVAYAANNRLVRRDLTAGRLHLTTLILPVVCSSSTTTRPPGRCPPRCASGTGPPWWPSADGGAMVVVYDRQFVSSMTTDGGSLAVVAVAVGLANAFGRDALAEGIETAADGAAALALGCRYGQGYWYARPMPTSEIERFVRERAVARAASN